MIQLKQVTKTYQTGPIEFHALKGIDLTINKGEFVAIVGPSGSGKSTLMNLIGCLDIPTKGEYNLDGSSVSTLTSNQLADARNKKIGFVFQAFNLLPYATTFENVEMPLLFARTTAKGRKKRVIKLLNRVGLGDKLNNKPTELSGGEMQRVAIARALANDPDIILADEPTGNLDTNSGREIINLFKELWKSGKTILMITHDMALAEEAPQIIKIRDGLIECNGHKTNAQSISA